MQWDMTDYDEMRYATQSSNRLGDDMLLIISLPGQ